MEEININQTPVSQPSISDLPAQNNKNIYKYLFFIAIIILLGVIVGAYFLLNNKINKLETKQIVDTTPVVEEISTIPTKTETIPTAIPTIEKETITPTKPKVDPLKEISTLLNPTNKPNFTVTISKIIGNYATGGAGFANDSGYGWIAAKVNGIWKIVTTGQDAPACSVVNEYQVPKEIYGSCY